MRDPVDARQPQSWRRGHPHAVKGGQHRGDNEVRPVGRHLARAFTGYLDPVAIRDYFSGDLVPEVKRETGDVKAGPR